MTLPLPASPASIKTDFPAGEMIRIESPSIGPTSSTWTCNSPVGLGGRERSHGKPHFQNAPTLPAIKSTSTAMAHPHPRVDRFTVHSPVLRESHHAEGRICLRGFALSGSDRAVRERKREAIYQ